MTKAKSILLYAHYREDTFEQQVQSDIINAKALVIIHSPYLSIPAIKRYANLLRATTNRGVRVCVFVRMPRDWKNRLNNCLPDNLIEEHQEFQKALSLLESLGVHVSLRRNVHQKLAIIDDAIMWEGSLNILSHHNSKEQMTRWNSRYQVARTIVDHRLNSCDVCAERLEFSLFRSKPTSYIEHARALWKRILQVGVSLGLSRQDLATKANVSPSYLSKMISGKRNVKLEVVVRLCAKMGLEVIAVPRFVLPAIAELMANYHQNKHDDD